MAGRPLESGQDSPRGDGLLAHRGDTVLDRQRRRRRHLVAAGAVLGLLAAACGGGGGGGSGGSEGVIRNTPPSDEGTPRRGGEIVYGLEAETGGGWCLPTAQLAASGIEVATAIYDTLTIPNDEGKIVPYLAESVEHNADYTEWTVAIRDGIKFHNGEELTADVVKQNLDALRNGLLSQFVLQDISSVEVVDPLTVLITVERPWIAFDGYLWGTGRFGMLAPEQLADRQTCPRNMIGTGPFRLVEWTPNDKLVVERNPDYWQEDENGVQLPYLDGITFRPVPEVAQRANGLKGGEFDLVHLTDGIQIRNLREEAAAGRLNMVEVDQATEIAYTMFNVSKPPFDNEKARRAYVLAIDREEIVEINGGGPDAIANQPFDEDVLGYVPHDELRYPEHDADEARRLVEEYEQETGEQLAFTLGATPDPSIVRTAQIIQSQMEGVGMEVEIETSEQASYINSTLGGGFQANLWRNHPGGDPDGQYVWWYTGSPVNFGRFSDPEIDELLDRGRSETDPAARKQIYQDISRRFAEQLWNSWIGYQTWAFPSGTDVHGLFGPALPDGNGRQTIRVSVQPTVGIWLDE
jgi:peptide/nickel transport system substrate-binding protein